MVKYRVACNIVLLERPSLSDTMEKHTMEILKKFESHIPLHIKSFSDFSREYVLLLEQTFKINCSVEKKLFGNMAADEKTIKILDDYLEKNRKFLNAQIDISAEFFKAYLNMRLTMMESYNKVVQDFATQIKTRMIENKILKIQ